MVGKRQSVIIERQPDNPYDSNALRAMNIAGEQVSNKQVASYEVNL
jgi:hypothetical protein